MAPARVASTDESGLAALYAALDALRRSDEPFDPRHDEAWRTLSRWVRERIVSTDRRRDDVMQETLVAIARHVRQMDASSPRQAAKWASTILRRKQIDLARADAVDAVAHGLSAGEDAIESVPSNDEGASPAVLEEQYRRIEEIVLAHVDATEPAASIRLTRRTMARAAIYRFVRDLEPDAVEARLALPEPVGKDRLYKWIERGRGLVADAVRVWAEARPDESDVQAIAAVVIELVEARRADAGRPRPERRKT